MQAMPSIVEADRRCHHASGDAQMGRLFPDDALVKRPTEERASNQVETTARFRVLGVDPGSRFTGYGVLDKFGNRLTFVAAGRIVAGTGDFGERLDTIYEGLTQIISTYQPNAAAVEGLFHHRNVDSALKLGHARGVALLACHRGGLSPVEYSPAVVKQAVVGNGRAEKGQVQHMIRIILGIRDEVLAEDAADALAIAICHAYRVRSALV